MMKAEDLKNSILQMAMQGKLVPQDPTDEPASVLLEKIKQEKEQLIKEGKIKHTSKELNIWNEKGHWYEKIGKNGKITCIDEMMTDIPNSWHITTLNNYLDVRDGTHDTPKYVSNGIPLITSKNLDNGKLNFSNIKYISLEDHEKISERSYVDNEDILFAMIGSIGNPVIVEKNQEFSIKNVALFKKISKKTNMKFIYYFLLLSQLEMKKKSSGAVQSFVSLTYLRNFKICIPPLDEQKRIVEKLEQILPQIEQYGKYEEQLTKLNNELPEKLKKSILQQAIQGKLTQQNPEDEPATKLLEKIKQEKEQLIKEGKIKRNKNESTIYKKGGHWYEVIDMNNEVKIIDDEIPFEIPEKWEWSRLGFITYNFGQKKPDKRFSYVDVGSIDNIHHKLNNKEKLIEKENAPSRARKIVKNGCVIYSTVRPYLLNTCIIDKKFTCEPIVSTAFAVLNPYNGINNKYLLYLLLNPYFISIVNTVMKGVAYPAISEKNLNNILLPIPPKEEQNRIIKKIEQIQFY